MQRLRSSPLLRSSLTRFFATYCLIAVLIIVLLGGALSMLFSGLMVREMTEAGLSILSQLQKAQEFLLHSVERSNQEILLDPWISGAMDYYENPRVVSVLQRIMRKISAVPITDDSIWSLCVHYLQEEVVLSSDSSFQRLEDYSDAAFLQSLQADGTAQGNAYVRLSAKTGPDPQARVISFVSRYPFNRSAAPQMLLVVNVKASYLDSMIDLMYTDGAGGLILYDAAGECISQVGLPLSAQELSLLGERLADYEAGVAYDLARQDASALRVMRFESGMYGWQYLYVLPDDAMAAKRGEVLYLAAAFCALALVGGMLASWLLSKHAVKPLRRLSDLVHADAPQSPYVDMAHITDSVASLVKESKSAKALLTEYWMSQRSLFLRELTLGTLDGVQDIEAQLAQYGLDLDPGGDFVVLCVAMHQYGAYLAAYLPAEKSLHRIAEHEVLINSVPEDMTAYCLDMRDNEKLLVCQVSARQFAPGEDEGGAWRLAFATALAEALEARLSFAYSVGVSRVRHTLTEVPSGYLEASFSLADRAIWSGRQVILYDWFVYPPSAQNVYPSQQEKALLHALRAGDRQRSMDALAAFHARLESAPDSGGAARRNDYIRLFFAMMQIVYEASPAFHVDDTGSIETFSALYHVDTPEQYTAVLAGRIDQLLALQESQDKRKQSLLAQQVASHIDAHLADDLSATHLASLFYVSPATLRRLFKESTGLTLKEYSLGARMNHAAQLLKQDMPVHKVASAVGYASPQAFISAFKQANGISPSQYWRGRADDGD